MRSFGHNIQHMKIMHFSVKKTPINCTSQTNGMHWTIQITNTAAYFAEMKEKHQQLLSAKGVGSLH